MSVMSLCHLRMPTTWCASASIVASKPPQLLEDDVADHDCCFGIALAVNTVFEAVLLTTVGGNPPVPGPSQGISFNVRIIWYKPSADSMKDFEGAVGCVYEHASNW